MNLYQQQQEVPKLTIQCMQQYQHLLGGVDGFIIHSKKYFKMHFCILKKKLRKKSKLSTSFLHTVIMRVTDKSLKKCRLGSFFDTFDYKEIGISTIWCQA